MIRRRAQRASRSRLLPTRLGTIGLSDEWRAWLIENVALGVEDEELTAALRTAGVSGVLAAREIAAARRSPAALGARRVALRLRQHELHARLRRALLRSASEWRVERRSGVCEVEFFERYYSAGVPVVLTDVLDPWPATSGWAPDAFKERFGDAVIQVTTGREADPTCDAHFEDFTETVTLREFCDRVTSTAPTNDFYLVGNNRAMSHAALGGLVDDVGGPHPYLDDRRDPGSTSLWFGPPGTRTLLHHDTANVLFCQVYGRKRFWLASPAETSLFRGIHQGFFAEVDAATAARPEELGGRNVRVQEVVLAAREGLFIPVGWWHEVEALSVSISLSLTAFRRSNRFEWYAPGKVGVPVAD